MPRIPILMPQLGEAIAEAVVRSIRVKPQERVEGDQEVMEVETNKTNMGVTVPCRGKVVEIIAVLDASYPVGATLGYLEVTAADAARAGFKDPGPARGNRKAPANRRAAEPTNAKPGESTAGVHFQVHEEDTFTVAEPTGVRPTVGLPVPANATGATYLSPRMKARMQELGLNAADLSGIAGTGAGGRVTVEDFEKFVRQLDSHAQSDASPMRIAVADAMRRSCLRPLATVGRPVLLDRLLLHRKQSPNKPGPTLYVIRALAMAIAENTAVGGRLVGGKIIHPRSIDIGFAVEVDDGVLVPIIREVDNKPLREMVEPYNQLVKQAQSRKLSLEATGTGIATVTNFGTFGLVWATPIPLPEQNLVLGLGAGRKKPVWSDEVEAFVPATEAELTLSFDHRILDGGAAGRLLSRVADLLQRPETL
ncbi:MAG: pyruvate dehydrogenase E2 component/2-oxoglutarate dehydrogenase E2 component [Verrucomicrobia bacterium]|nr:MAG: pyruvate dehydrogenase E2 component/2-oxoglutarate dehydrogenase E2 component [Verrucomicrobiota bacterium]